MWVQIPLPDPIKMKKLFILFLTCRLEVAYVVAMILLWIYCEYRDQHRPHTIVYSLAGHVTSIFTVTNPEYVSYSAQWRVTSNGLTLCNVPTTNTYWHVWKWLK